MDLRVLEKSPHLAPLLVKLYESEKLYQLAKDQNPLAKVELAGAVAALLEVELSPREQELITDVLSSLMRQAVMDLRQALSLRLSTLPHVPLRLILQMANDEIEIAEPILRKSPVLSDLDLLYIIKSQGSAYWEAIADREELSPQIINMLADTQDVPTALALSENERITLTNHAMKVLTVMAAQNESLAKPLLARPEMPEAFARKLYEFVGKELQASINAQYGSLGQQAEEAVADVFEEFSGTLSSEYMPTTQMIKAAERAATLGSLNMHVMIDTLTRGQIANFVAMFACYTGLSAKRIHDFLKQPCPKGLAIACRAFGIQKSDFSRIYLMTHRMRARGRVVNNRDILEILSYFDKVKQDIAMRIVEREARV